MNNIQQTNKKTRIEKGKKQNKNTKQEITQFVKNLTKY